MSIATICCTGTSSRQVLRFADGAAVFTAMSDMWTERPSDHRDGRGGGAFEIEQRESGAHATVLQSTQTGVSLYERMEYRT